MRPFAIITGASGEIGSAISRKLAGEGYDLALFGNRNTDSLAETARLCRREEGLADIFTGDLGNPATARELLSRAMDGRDRIDLLVNCAGVSYIGLLTDMTDSDWSDIISTNLSSAFYTCRFAIPYMVRLKSGRIINISSVWGNMGASCEAAYSASKGGLNSLTKALAKELAPSGIAVNALACGMIDTKMNGIFSQEEIEEICREIPAGRMGTPEETAETVYLLSRAPVYLTGQILTLDGGWC